MHLWYTRLQILTCDRKLECKIVMYDLNADLLTYLAMKTIFTRYDK